MWVRIRIPCASRRVKAIAIHVQALIRFKSSLGWSIYRTRASSKVTFCASQLFLPPTCKFWVLLAFTQDVKALVYRARNTWSQVGSHLTVTGMVLNFTAFREENFEKWRRDTIFGPCLQSTRSVHAIISAAEAQLYCRTV